MVRRTEVRQLNAADNINDLRIPPGNRLEKLAGNRAGQHSIRINDFEFLGPAFPPWAAPGRDAILQPPKPLVRPSEQVLDHLVNYETDVEASA